MFVKPIPGVVVRDPISKLPLPAEGRAVPESSYWLRRVQGGDVKVVTLVAETSTSKNTKETR